MNWSLGKTGNGRTTLIAIILAGVFIIVGGFLISTLTGPVLPIQASAESESVDALLRVLMFLGGIVFLLVQGLLVFTIIRFRRRQGDESDGAAFNGNTTLEVVWTVIPATVVVFLAIYSYSVFVDIRQPKADELVVPTVGQRFVWTFSYEDPLGRIPEDLPQRFTDSTLHTYVGRTVLMQMSTPDVNHAFWVPTMRIKQDLLAGRITEVRFTPTVAGRYRIVCTELCGAGHGGMFSYIQVYANEQEWMERFIDNRVDRIINPPDDPVERGRLEVVQYPCAGCHTLDDLEWPGTTGPTLNGIADTSVRRASASGSGSPEAYIANSLRHPNNYPAPGFQIGVMPQFGPEPDRPPVIEGAYYQYMPDEELVDIVAYLCTQTVSAESPCGDIDSITAAVEAQR